MDTAVEGSKESSRIISGASSHAPSTGNSQSGSEGASEDHVEAEVAFKERQARSDSKPSPMPVPWHVCRPGMKGDDRSRRQQPKLFLAWPCNCLFVGRSTEAFLPQQVEESCRMGLWSQAVAGQSHGLASKGSTTHVGRHGPA